MKIDNYMISSYYDLFIYDKFRLYAGIGMGKAKISAFTNDLVVSGSLSDTRSSWLGEAGISYELNRHITLYAGLRQVDMGTIDLPISLFGILNAGNYTVHTKSKELFAGLRCSF